MTIELNHYGLCLDSRLCYIALDWALLVTAAVLIVGYKVWRKSQNKF